LNTSSCSKLSLLDYPGDDAEDGDFVVGVNGYGREAVVVFGAGAQHDAAGGSVNAFRASAPRRREKNGFRKALFFALVDKTTVLTTRKSLIYLAVYFFIRIFG